MNVSVIIPNYNHGLYLGKRIESVLNQIYDNFEIIILDDCSTDNSVEVIEKYRQHPKVTNIILNNVNSGTTFKQWKKGIDLAKGEWIWIAESDDYCEPSFLENLVTEVENKPNAVLAYCQSIMFTNDEQIHTKTSWDKLITPMSGKEWVASEMLGTCNLLNASMAIFKKSASHQIDWSITNFKLCGDWFFWTQIASKGDVVVSGKYHNYFRKHMKSASNSPSLNGAYYLEGIKVFHYAVKTFEFTENEIERGLIKYVKHYYHNISGIEKDSVRKSAWQCLEEIDKEKAIKILHELEKANKREIIKSAFFRALSFKWLLPSSKSFKEQI